MVKFLHMNELLNSFYFVPLPSPRASESFISSQQMRKEKVEDLVLFNYFNQSVTPISSAQILSVRMSHMANKTQKN